MKYIFINGARYTHIILIKLLWILNFENIKLIEFIPINEGTIENK